MSVNAAYVASSPPLRFTSLLNMSFYESALQTCKYSVPSPTSVDKTFAIKSGDIVSCSTYSPSANSVSLHSNNLCVTWLEELCKFDISPLIFPKFVWKFDKTFSMCASVSSQF